MLPRLQAERQMAAIEAAAFPDMDKDGRRVVLRKYQADLGDQTKPAKATAADLAGLGITVEYVTADGLPDDGKRREATDAPNVTGG